MISKKELLRRIEQLEKHAHSYTTNDIKHFSTEPSVYTDPLGRTFPYYPEVGSVKEIIGAIIKHCGIEFKTIPPTEKRLEVIKKEPAKRSV